jgi:hypothetical protein
MKLWRRLTLLVPLGLVLAGCGEWELTQNAELNANVAPARISYSATITEDANGNISISFQTPAEGNVTEQTVPVVTLNARPGSLGVNLEGYSLEYFYSDGTPVIPGDSMMMVSESALPTVPPGIFCEPTDGSTPPTIPVQPPSIISDCSINNPNAVFAPGAPVSFTVLNPLPPRIAYELFCDLRPDVGAYARMTIFGQDSLRRDFTLEVPSIPITASGDFQVPNLGSVCF